MITLKRVKEICSQFGSKRVLVFGDVILDRYIFGNVNRISPEAPVPVLKVEKEEYRAGGAGNVASNIDKLGSCGVLMGITGDDSFADVLLEHKKTNRTLFKSPENQTLVKTRVIAQRQQIVRIDREELIRVNTGLEESIMKQIESFSIGDIHGIIVSDYAKGTLTPGIMKSLKQKALELNIPVIVDPKPANFHLYKNIDGITPNRSEAEAMSNRKIECDADASEASKIIRTKCNARFSIVTRGDKGITAVEQGKKAFHFPAFNHEVYDVTGAGDTVAAVLVLSLISGATLREAVELSNVAASIVVERIGASQITQEELIEQAKNLY